WVLSLPSGYRFDEAAGRIYSAFWMHGPYQSLFERLGRGAPLGAYCANHSTLHHRFPAHFDDSIPAWMQVIHGLAESSATPGWGGNMASSVMRGDREMAPAEIEDAFGLDLSVARGSA